MVKEFNVFYVYAYLRADRTPYYVGKGKGRRVYSTSRHIKKPKDKSRIVFLRSGLSEEKAFDWERFYIKHYGRIDLGTGILRNLTDGGEGSSGCVITEETREKKRKTKRNKKIELTRMVDGAVFTYGSLSDAAREFNLNVGQLGQVCRGKRYSTGGFLARYWSPDLEDWGEGLFYKVEEVIQKQESRTKRAGETIKLKMQRAVELTRTSDGTVFVYECMNDASRALNIHHQNLVKVCRGERKSTGGYTARYLVLSTPPNL